ncbi:MAG: hypothetical protein HY055_16020 [Magnetospirillum sp.]|nr:hypothetical protein [Magnetospirillum sp.]
MAELRRNLYTIGGVCGEHRISHIASSEPVILQDCSGYGDRNGLATWAAFAGAVLLYQPFDSPGLDSYWLNYLAAHCAAALAPSRRDDRCDNCREQRRCPARDRCILRYFRTIKSRDLHTQAKLIMAQTPLAGFNALQLQAIFRSFIILYRNKGRDYRKRPRTMTLGAWIKRTLDKALTA